MLLAAHESRREILKSRSRFMLPTVAPGQTAGVLRIASSVLHILSQTASRLDYVATAALVIGRKAAQERFSEEASGLQCHCTGNVFLKSSTASSRTTPQKRTAHTKPGLTRGT
jgi:hypothetical protein